MIFRAAWVGSSALPWLQGGPLPPSPPRRSSTPAVVESRSPRSPETPQGDVMEVKIYRKQGKTWENPNFGAIKWLEIRGFTMVFGLGKSQELSWWITRFLGLTTLGLSANPPHAPKWQRLWRHCSHQTYLGGSSIREKKRNENRSHSRSHMFSMSCAEYLSVVGNRSETIGTRKTWMILDGLIFWIPFIKWSIAIFITQL